MTTPVTDLERRLSTERTLDIFTMTPKVLHLSMMYSGSHQDTLERSSPNITLIIDIYPRTSILIGRHNILHAARNRH